MINCIRYDGLNVMNCHGSFWILQEDGSFSFGQNEIESAVSPIGGGEKLKIVQRKELKNISQDKIFTKMIEEYYSDGSAACYMYPRQMQTTYMLFNKLLVTLTSHGYVTIINNYGPLSIFYKDKVFYKKEFINILACIDEFEYFSPPCLRESIVSCSA